MVEKEMENMLPSDMTVGQIKTEGNRRNSYSKVVIEGVRRKARVFVGDSINRALNKGDDVVVGFPG